MEGIGDIVLGDAQAARAADSAEEQIRINNIWSYAQAALKLIGAYLKIDTGNVAGTPFDPSDHGGPVGPTPVEPSEEPPGQ
jgi:hypothetical protein